MKKYDKVLTVKLTQQQYTELLALAACWDMQPSTYVRHLITKQTKEESR